MLDLFEAIIGIGVFYAICFTMIMWVCCRMRTEEIIQVEHS